MRRAVVSVLLTTALVAACSGESEQPSGSRSRRQHLHRADHHVGRGGVHPERQARARVRRAVGDLDEPRYAGHAAGG